MGNYLYGVTHNGVHTDVSSSEKGAKNYATRHGYTAVSRRNYMSGFVEIVAVKNESGKWSAA